MPAPACTIPDCNGIYCAKGLCEKHYKRWQTHGDPLVGAFQPRVEFDELWTQGEPDECWPWRGVIDNRLVKYKGKSASRVVYAKLRGPIPVDHILERTCRNHLCVNPDHMEAITRSAATARRNRGI